jgi:hypothetical protein
MPIADRRPALKCGVGVVDLDTGRLVASLEFVSGVEEIFDVQVVPNARCPMLFGPYDSLDGVAPIGTIPQSPPAPNVNGTLYFSANTGTTSLEWKRDGTDATDAPPGGLDSAAVTTPGSKALPPRGAPQVLFRSYSLW